MTFDRRRLLPILIAAACGFAGFTSADEDPPLQISGRYPRLAMFNHQGECGIGAVVPWADRLWVITYAPHMPNGSDDKLYEIEPSLHRITRPESVGGTPAGRMIHRESNQLVIGPYFIDARRNVRVVPPAKMPIRITAIARHLTDPANRVYAFDMENALYEVDVHSLAATKLFDRCAPGAHGKGAYTGQGRFIIANNGDKGPNNKPPAAEDPAPKDPRSTGALAEWDGHAWRVVERRAFLDVTGPAGISPSDTNDPAPLWAIGWDKRSVLLNARDGGQWHTFRLPIADWSYTARHGWYTEWPRIREVTGGKFLMNMHGGWFDFPKTFSSANAADLRPIATHLKITADFCGWNDRIVFGCDDASVMENPLLGQSQSNLWFTTWDELRNCGRQAGEGGVWVNDDVKANEASEPYLFAGYGQRALHLSHGSDQPVTFTIEADADGHGNWSAYQSITVPARGYAWHVFPENASGEWVRVKAERDCPKTTAYFHYGPGGGAATAEAMRAVPMESNGGTLRPLGGDRGTLLYQPPSGNAREITAGLQARPYTGKPIEEPPSKGAAKDFAVSSDESSVILTYGKSRYRLPRSAEFDPKARDIREVATERFLLNAAGSFYLLPRPSAGGPMHMKPVCTHDTPITDFCSWRGLLVLADKTAGLKFGDIDDLWKLGKPRGRGGPWLNTPVQPRRPSDAYLLYGYDRKSLDLSHDAATTVHMTVEVDYLGDGSWHPFQTIDVPSRQTAKYEFPGGYSAHWVRFRCDAACRATAALAYD